MSARMTHLLRCGVGTQRLFDGQVDRWIAIWTAGIFLFLNFTRETHFVTWNLTSTAPLALR